MLRKKPKIEHPYSEDIVIDVLAYEAIRGTFRNGRDRALALGSRYKPVQRRVNEIYRENEEEANERIKSK